MWCAQKFVSGHQCVRSQLYQLLVEDGDALLNELGPINELVETSDKGIGTEVEDGLKLVISLHALLGTGDSQTMRPRGKIKNLGIIILVDTEVCIISLIRKWLKEWGCIHRLLMVSRCQW